MTPYKRSRIIVFVNELPETISGKLRRVELRRIKKERRDRNQGGETEYFGEISLPK